MNKGKVLVVIGVLFTITGAVLIPVYGVIHFIKFARDAEMEAFLVPGSLEFALEHPGRYYLWNDYITFFEGVSFNRSEEPPHGLVVDVRGEKGQVLPFVPRMNISMSTGSVKRNSIGYVEVDDPQKIVIHVSEIAEQRIFSFGRSVIVSMILQIFLLVFVALMVFSAGVALVVVGAVKGPGKTRHMSQRAGV